MKHTYEFTTDDKAYVWFKGSWLGFFSHGFTTDKLDKTDYLLLKKHVRTWDQIYRGTDGFTIDYIQSEACEEMFSPQYTERGTLVACIRKEVWEELKTKFE